MKGIKLFSWILVVSLFGDGVAFGAGEACPYQRVPEDTQMLAVNARMKSQPLVIEITNAQKQTLLSACMGGNVPNDIRHMYRAWHEDWNEFVEEVTVNPDTGTHLLQAPANGVSRVVRTGRAAFGALFIARLTSTIALGLGAIVGSSCGEVIRMFQQGIPHLERVAFINRNFDDAIKRWTVVQAPGRPCTIPYGSTIARYGINMLRHQMIGASQQIKITQDLFSGQNMNLQDGYLTRVDIGEDNRALVDRLFLDLADRLRADRTVIESEVETNLRREQRRALDGGGRTN